MLATMTAATGASLIAVGGGIGAAAATFVTLLVKFLRRNGNNGASGRVGAEDVRTELHERISREMTHVDDHYVRTDLCKIMSKQLQRDMDGIKTDVQCVRTDIQGIRAEIDKLVAHFLEGD